MPTEGMIELPPDIDDDQVQDANENLRGDQNGVSAQPQPGNAVSTTAPDEAADMESNAAKQPAKNGAPQLEPEPYSAFKIPTANLLRAALPRISTKPNSASPFVLDKQSENFLGLYTILFTSHVGFHANRVCKSKGRKKITADHVMNALRVMQAEDPRFEGIVEYARMWLVERESAKAAAAAQEESKAQSKRGRPPKRKASNAESADEDEDDIEDDDADDEEEQNMTPYEGAQMDTTDPRAAPQNLEQSSTVDEEMDTDPQEPRDSRLVAGSNAGKGSDGMDVDSETTNALPREE